MYTETLQLQKKNTFLSSRNVYNVAILEYSNLIRSCIKSVINSSVGLDLVVEAKNADELFEKMTSVHADVLIVDVLRIENSGLKVLRKIHRTHPQLPVLLITSRDYSDCFKDYLSLGVSGFIYEDASSMELLNAAKQLCNGKKYFSNGISSDFGSWIPSSSRDLPEAPKLTDREVTVLKLICRGLSYKEIGDQLYISPRTVETHKRNIQTKLNVKSTAEMVKYAFHNNILN